MTHDPAGLRHVHARLNGVRIHRVELGAGPAVVLLHGFPDCWWSWRHQLEPLAAAGLRVIACDLRGYNESEAPRGIHAYATHHSADDIAALIEAECGGRAAVVGHDWGGIAAWLLATRRPELLTRVVVLNAPHPAAYRRALLTTTQLARSWYVLAAQLPWLPERLLSARRAALLGWYYRREAARTGAFDEEDIRRYRATFATPAALRGPLGYYRNGLRLLARRSRRRRGASEPGGGGARGRPRGRGRTTVPMLVIWGLRDGALVPSLADDAARYAADVRIVKLARSGHWPHRDAAADVNRLLIDFLA